ncbi:hypothetical protein EK0264_12575 [Epidermidibacterium keratini]|uniref:RNA polymerase subunit sigma-24 n=1 Tax=Epidermidibacterium keratini TaxID=1891644 RepID=A0A7L4YPU5_9ACTN|nr:sigma factor-like helix-turn-helix DNA-binding protein [Epidermidibacterium keratini]QHC01042.1 hypothetical protein EK0264_12575 [Epidermidibacterium keratini]
MAAGAIDEAHLPEEAAEIADSVGLAMLVMLEQLSPKERVAFVLREVFEVPAAEVAQTLDSTPEAVRTMVTRARSHLRSGERRYDHDPHTHLALAETFASALRSGDLDAACQVLAPDVLLVTDGGGKVKAALRPIEGATKVARFFLGLFEMYGDYTLVPTTLNRQPALLVTAGDDLTAVSFEVTGGRIERIWVMRNPDKIAHISAIQP